MLSCDLQTTGYIFIIILGISLLFGYELRSYVPIYKQNSYGNVSTTKCALFYLNALH